MQVIDFHSRNVKNPAVYDSVLENGRLYESTFGVPEAWVFMMLSQNRRISAKKFRSYTAQDCLDLHEQTIVMFVGLKRLEPTSVFSLRK